MPIKKLTQELLGFGLREWRVSNWSSHTKDPENEPNYFRIIAHDEKEATLLYLSLPYLSYKEFLDEGLSLDHLPTEFTQLGVAVSPDHTGKYVEGFEDSEISSINPFTGKMTLVTRTINGKIWEDQGDNGELLDVDVMAQYEDPDFIFDEEEF
jgi:hypothetical protein